MTALIDDYFNISQLADELKVTERTIRRYQTLPNGLPSALIGGRVLYRKASVIDWLKNKERKPNQRRVR